MLEDVLGVLLAQPRRRTEVSELGGAEGAGGASEASLASERRVGGHCVVAVVVGRGAGDAGNLHLLRREDV